MDFGLLQAEAYDYRLRVGRFADKAIFISLLALLVLAAIPYGTAEIWWKTGFISFFFLLGAFSVIEHLLSGDSRFQGWTVVTPLLILACYAFLQSISLGPGSASMTSIPEPLWSTVSADPYHTRLFALQLLGLTVSVALFFRYANTEARLATLLNVIIAVAVASAIFGILRQTTQTTTGFGLPLLQLNQGYGQFINKNHFAFLMEMGLGLSLGIILGGGTKREHILIYFASLLPIWTALVLSNSRGALVAMVAQLMGAALLFPGILSPHTKDALPGFMRVGTLLPIRILLLGVLVIGVSVGTVWLGGDRLVSNLESVRAEFDIKESRQGVTRNEIWRATWLMFKDNPIAGVGLGAYWIAIPKYHDASGTLTPQEAHNEYLELLASGGCIGMAIGIWFVIALVQRTRESLSASNQFRRAAAFGACLGIIGVAVHSLVDFGLHMIANALVFAALVVIATAKIRNEN